MRKKLYVCIGLFLAMLSACSTKSKRSMDSKADSGGQLKAAVYISGSSLEAADETESDEGQEEWEYSIENGHAAIVSYKGSETEVVIPAVLEDCPVTEIYEMAFYECENAENIVKIVVPDSVTDIGALAFANLPELEAVTLSDNLHNISNACFYMDEKLRNVIIPDSVTDIFDEAFCECDKLTAIEIPAGVEGIHANAFAQSGLETIIFHEGLQTIDSYAFAETNIRTLDLPDSVTQIGYHAFEKCPRLKNVTLPESELHLDGFSFYQCVNLSNIEFQCTKLLTGGYDFAETDWMDTKLSEEKEFIIENGTLLCIKDYSGKLNVPDTVSVIGGQAFMQWTEPGYTMRDNEEITSITLPDSVTYICEDAFVKLKGIKKLVIPKSVEMVEAPQFNGWIEGQTVVIEPEKEVYSNWETDWDNNKKITMEFVNP